MRQINVPFWLKEEDEKGADYGAEANVPGQSRMSYTTNSFLTVKNEAFPFFYQMYHEFLGNCHLQCANFESFFFFLFENLGAEKVAVHRPIGASFFVISIALKALSVLD